MSHCFSWLVTVWHIHQEREVFESVGDKSKLMTNCFEVTMVQAHICLFVNVFKAYDFIPCEGANFTVLLKLRPMLTVN